MPISSEVDPEGDTVGVTLREGFATEIDGFGCFLLNVYFRFLFFQEIPSTEPPMDQPALGYTLLVLLVFLSGVDGSCGQRPLATHAHDINSLRVALAMRTKASFQETGCCTEELFRSW